ncbi:MAG: hypothetical protein K6E27_05860 [Eubacterium sp.]|nr:hypothetical protein [Eubacterium sp.]
MACFIVSAAEAVVVKAVEKAEEKKEAKREEAGEVSTRRIPLSRKLSWLSYMLLGGSFLLMFEHIWHGEIVPWFPFLTAMSDHADMMEMFHEMATVGVCMALLITFVWAGVCIVAERIARREDSVATEM